MRLKILPLVVFALLVSAGPASGTPSGHNATDRLSFPARAFGRAPTARAASANAGFAGIPDTTQAPFKAAGRLFVRFGQGIEGRCTATAIDSPSRTLVLTAGHCLYLRPCFFCRALAAKQILFVPAYTRGSAPFGQFEGRNWYILRGWRVAQNDDLDFAAILTSPNANGENVADAVGGGVRIALDRPRDQTYQLLGYPGKSQQQMHGCEAPFAGEDRRTFRLGGPPTMRVRCSMRHGASGGPWLIEGGTEIDGLTSYFYANEWAYTYSPYFSQSTVGALVSGL